MSFASEVRTLFDRIGFDSERRKAVKITLESLPKNVEDAVSSAVQKINNDGFAASYKPFYGDHPIQWHVTINGFDVAVDLQNLAERVRQDPYLDIGDLVESEILIQLKRFASHENN